MKQPLSRRALALAVLPLLLGACAPAAHVGAAPAAHAVLQDAGGVLDAIHARYAENWYRTVFFRQTVVRRGADGAPREPEVWAEWADLPGRLRIEFDNGASGDGVIYAGDSLYVFRADSLVRRAEQRNPLVLLGFDMYVQSPQRTREILHAEGFDLSRFHVADWQGRPAYVIGAEAGDLRSPQFWVEVDRLLFVRLIQPTGPGGSRTSDIRFNGYEPLAGGWIAPEVVFLVDGEEVMREDYFDIEADAVLDPRLFEPAHWRRSSSRGG